MKNKINLIKITLISCAITFSSYFTSTISRSYAIENFPESNITTNATTEGITENSNFQTEHNIEIAKKLKEHVNNYKKNIYNLFPNKSLLKSKAFKTIIQGLNRPLFNLIHCLMRPTPNMNKTNELNILDYLYEKCWYCIDNFILPSINADKINISKIKEAVSTFFKSCDNDNKPLIKLLKKNTHLIPQFKKLNTDFIDALTVSLEHYRDLNEDYPSFTKPSLIKTYETLKLLISNNRGCINQYLTNRIDTL